MVPETLRAGRRLHWGGWLVTVLFPGPVDQVRFIKPAIDVIVFFDSASTRSEMAFFILYIDAGWFVVLRPNMPRWCHFVGIVLLNSIGAGTL